MKRAQPILVWGIVTNGMHVRLENVRSTRNAASDHMRYLNKTYPHCAGERRIARLEIREVEGE